jgi:hypothetical protein
VIANEYRAGRLSAHITHAFFNSVRDLVDYLPANRRNPAWTIDLIPMDPASVCFILIYSFQLPLTELVPHAGFSVDPSVVYHSPRPARRFAGGTIPCAGYVRLRLCVALVEEGSGGVLAANRDFPPSSFRVCGFLCGNLFAALRALYSARALYYAHPPSCDSASTVGTFCSRFCELRHPPATWECEEGPAHTAEGIRDCCIA